MSLLSAYKENPNDTDPSEKSEVSCQLRQRPREIASAWFSDSWERESGSSEETSEEQKDDDIALAQPKFKTTPVFTEKADENAID